MNGRVKWFLGFVSLSLIMGGFCVFLKNTVPNRQDTSSVSSVSEKRAVDVVIDAGHGGEDGGCVGAGGVCEKDLNLSVAVKVYDILTVAGVNAVMTRSDDRMLYDLYGDLEDYESVKKTYDLKNRVRFARESECALFVSVHMNKFSDSSYNGLQVYYSGNASDSITAALRVQSYAKEYLQPENEREIKRAGSNIYVLHRSQMPAILVECGFLSNTAEAELLKERDYQKKLALTVSAAIMDSMANFRS